MIAEEARDSEEEAEDLMRGQSGERNISKSPFSAKLSTATTHKLSKPVREASTTFPDSNAPEALLKKGHDTLFIAENENRPNEARSFHQDDPKISCGDRGVSSHYASGQLPDPCAKTTKSGNTDVPKVVDGQCTSEFAELVNDLKLTSESIEALVHSDAKVSAMSNSRKNLKKFSPPKNLNENSANVSGTSASPLNDLKFSINRETSSSKVEKASKRISFPCVEGSGKGSDWREPNSVLPQKRTIESSTKFKSKMTSGAKLSIEKTPSPNVVNQGLKLTSLMDEPPEIEDHFSVGKGGMKNPETVSSKSLQCDDAYQNSAQRYAQSLSEPKINGKPDIAGFGMGEVAQDGNETKPHNAKNDLECSYPSNKKYQNEESTGLTTLDLCNKVSDKLIKKSPRKKTVAKKCLGSRRKLGAIAKQKGLISLNESTHEGNSASRFSGCKETASSDDKKLHTPSKIVDAETSSELERVSKSAENAGGGEFQDDETEAQDEKCEYEAMTIDENNAELVHLSKKADALTEKSEAIQHISKCEEAEPPKEGPNETEQSVLEPVDSTSKVKQKQKGRKLAGRNKKTTVGKDVMRSEEGVYGVRIDNGGKDKAEMETLEKVSLPVGRNDSSATPAINSENFREVEKENRPIDGEKDTGEGISIRNSVIKASVDPANINQKAKKSALKSSVSEDDKRVKREAACFIVSGHRLQRKEFQQIIRRLKGRVCRDSHQWSYQATHFIAPDPIRRTEKFFAASASGRYGNAVIV